MLRIDPMNFTSPHQLMSTNSNNNNNNTDNLSSSSSNSNNATDVDAATTRTNEICSGSLYKENRIQEHVERYKIVQIIEARLMQQQQEPQQQQPPQQPHTSSDATNINSSSRHGTFKVAQSLEQHLFQKAPSLQAHLNRSTLDARLRLFLKQVVKAKLAQKQRVSKSSLLRPQAFRQAHVDYDQLSKLCRDIQRLKFHHYCNNNTSLSSHAPPQQRQQAAAAPSQQALPRALQQLFLETNPLLHAFYKTPISKIPSVPWTQLMNQAQDNIRDYKEWNHDSSSRVAS